VLRTAHTGSPLVQPPRGHAKDPCERTHAADAPRADRGGVVMATVHLLEPAAAANVKRMRHRTVASDGVELALTRFAGNATRPVPVVLTHGTFSNGRICSRLAEYLAENWFDCWVLDLRGH